MQKPFYVYVHKRATDGQIFYVGQGSVKYKRAFHSAKTHRNAYWIRTMKKHGHTIEIWSYWNTKEESCQEEIKLIEFFRSVYCPLTNLTSGGEGTTGRKQPERIKKLLSICAQNRKGAFSQRGIQTTLVFNSGEERDFVIGKLAAEFLNVRPCSLADWIAGRYKPSKKHELKAIRTKNKQGKVREIQFNKENQNDNSCSTIA